uniref:Uncharacterized protein n=1 Tax=Pyxicephalus adspersus TaxID=30357 RepID=A0A499QZ35_PYXAD|nr:hypothetical protein maker-240M17-exonerate_protein2genome-gene-0.26 [Pyxicephalus adspersus]
MDDGRRPILMKGKGRVRSRVPLRRSPPPLSIEHERCCMYSIVHASCSLFSLERIVKDPFQREKLQVCTQLNTDQPKH